MDLLRSYGKILARGDFVENAPSVGREEWSYFSGTPPRPRDRMEGLFAQILHPSHKRGERGHIHVCRIETGLCDYSVPAGEKNRSREDLFAHSISKRTTMRKRTWMLWELLIGMTLATVLLTALFQLLRTNVTLDHKLRGAREEASQKEHLIERLQFFVSQIEKRGGKSSFYTAKLDDDGTSPSLIFLYNAPLDPNPQLSGPTWGRLYLNQSQQLCFTQWERSGIDFRTEVLTTGVKELEWEFLAPQTESKKKSPWRSHWAEEKGSLPSTLRLTLSYKDPREKKLRLAFLLPVPLSLELSE